MLSVKCSARLTAIGLSLLVSGATAADPLLEGRVSRLERILENQGGSEFMLRLQQMQQELRTLHGQVEQQGFEIERLKQRLGGTAVPSAPPIAVDAPSGFSGLEALRDPRPVLPPTGLIDSDADSDAGEPRSPFDPVPAETPEAVPHPRSFAPGGSGGIPALPAPETSQGTEREQYREAFDLLKKREYSSAIAAFDRLLQQYPQGEFADNAHYWLAETYYAQRDLSAALREFQHLTEYAPDSPRLPGALLKIGYILDEQQQSAQARATLEQLIARYPNTTEARLARARLERPGVTPP